MNALLAYRRLLRNRPLSTLLAGEFVSGIGDWLYIVAILVVIYRESGDAAVLGAFGAARVLPYILLSIPAGLVVDRVDRRLVLLVSDVGRGLCMLGMAVTVATDGPVWVIVALAILAACGSTFFYPAIGAYLPSLARDERELGPANSAWASLDNLGFIIGPALGGLLLATGGVTFAFLINAATFAVISVVLWRLPPSIPRREAPAARPASPAAPETAETAPGEAAASIREPAATLDREPSPVPVESVVRPMSGILLVRFVDGFINGGIAIATVILAVEILRAGEAATGFLNAAIGVGGLLGALVSGVLVLRRSLGPPLLVGAVALGLGAVVVGFSSTLALAMVGIAIVSIGVVLLDVVTTTLLQRVTTDAVRGRATGVLVTASSLAEAIGSLVLPVLITTFSVSLVFGIAGATIVVAGVVSVVLIGAAGTRASSPFEETLGRVSRLPLFTGVPAASLEAALGRLELVPVASGETIVRQGEAADRFYIVRSGSFVVTQQVEGAVRELRRLGADDVFGELGLLHGLPRSASVSATSDGELLALAPDDFLELVRGGPALRGRLLGLYAGPSSGAR